MLFNCLSRLKKWMMSTWTVCTISRLCICCLISLLSFFIDVGVSSSKCDNTSHDTATSSSAIPVESEQTSFKKQPQPQPQLQPTETAETIETALNSQSHGDTITPQDANDSTDLITSEHVSNIAVQNPKRTRLR